MDERSYVAQALFNRLAERGIEFSVLGDAARIPEALPSDLDMAVSPRDLEEMPGTISGFCHDFGLRLVQLIRHERSARYFVIAWLDGVGGLRYLAPDFCADYRRAGRLILASDELLSQRREALGADGLPRGFYVPSPDVQFVYYLCKKVDKLELDAAQGDYLSRQWHADPDGALRRMVRYWPELNDNGLLARAAACNDWAGVQAELPQLRRALRRSVARTPLEMLAEAGRLLERVARPTGMTIAFAGPDGSGKSSLIERVRADLAPAFRRTRVFHLRPRLLATARDARPVVGPYVAPARGPAASLAKLAYLVTDYVAGYFLKLRPFVTRSGLVLFDRYFHDLLADPRRYRYGAPLSLARAAACLVPEPDLWVVLDATVETLQSRKQEVTARESGEQRRAYLALAAQVGDAVLIDANRDASLVVAQTTQAILTRLENRVERRYVPTYPENPLRARVLLFFCRHRVPLLSRLIRLLFNSDIYCRIRSPILLAHPYGIIIHSKAQLGSRVTVMQQVTIGSKDPGDNIAPVIEDDVYIGAGAKVLGGIRVGRGSVIGANAVVTRDVPSYSTAVGFNRILRKGTCTDAQAAADAEDVAAGSARHAYPLEA